MPAHHTPLPPRGILHLAMLLLLLTACATAPANPPTPTATAVASTPAAPPEADTPAPTENESTPAAAAPSAGLCPNVPRPAIVARHISEDGQPHALVTSLDGQSECQLPLQGTPRTQLVAAAGQLFYDVLDDATQTVTIWRVTAEGQSQPLDFTATNVSQTNLFAFLVSPDGSQIVWGTSTLDVSAPPPPPALSSMWRADIDGDNKVTLLDQVPFSRDGQFTYPLPIRFSADGQTLYYAIQPDWQMAVWSATNGRYDSLYTIPTAGGQPTPLFHCQDETLILCIGDISPDGSTFTYTTPAQRAIQVVGTDGTAISTLAAARDYVGPALFSPTGELAFTSAVVDSSGFPVPVPGVINLVPAPYQDEPESLLGANGVATLVQWVDAEHLIYYHVQESQSGMVLVGKDGSSHHLPGDLGSLNSPLTILR